MKLVCRTATKHDVKQAHKIGGIHTTDTGHGSLSKIYKTLTPVLT